MKISDRKRSLLFYFIIVWIVLTGLIIYFNFPLISGEISYYFRDGNKDKISDATQNNNTNNQTNTQNSNNENKIAEFKIIIPKINVSAPVVEPASISDKDILKALENGVVHYPETAKPGEVGNAFFTGHSSNYRWAKGSYNYVFSLLNKMQNGDQVTVHYNGQKYIYEVFEIIVVSSKDVSVLDQTDSSIVSLMTCDPPGTSWKRRVVKAKQIEPDPAKNKIKGTKNSEGINQLIGN